jgi:beta-phosphoglucomutase
VIKEGNGGTPAFVKHMIDTILFDCDGVVINSEGLWDSCQEEFLRRRGRLYDRERSKHLLTGRTLREGVRVLRQEYDLKGDLDDLTLEQLELVHSSFSSDVCFMEGFSRFFEEIRQLFKTGIATALDGELLAIVNSRLDLLSLFGDRIFTVSSVGNRSKPAPDVFLYAAEELGSEPENCVVIEDSRNGIEAARRAGMACIGLATTYTRDQLSSADVVVRSFRDIDVNMISKLR